MITMVLLAEHALTAHDVGRVAHLHDPEPVRVRLVVPVDTSHSAVVEALDEVALGRLREALTDSGTPNPTQAQARAQAALDASLHALRAAGVQADGQLAPDDPVNEVAALAETLPADEIIVVTDPHLLEEAVRRDWASRLRAVAGRPVLHVVAGTDRVVS